MTSIKVKVVRRPQIKVKALVKFPANVVATPFLTVTNSNGTYTFAVDYSLLSPGPIVDPTTAFIAVSDTSAGIYKTVALSALLTSSLDADLQAIAALTGTGILVRTAANTWAVRTLTAPAAGITITNADGVSGNPTLVLANDLAAIEGLAANGLAARTATDTWIVRTVTAGASIGVTNGDGVAGNPTIAVTDAELVALAGLVSAADQVPFFTGSGTASLASFPTFGRSIAAAASQAAARTVLALTPGTDVQAFDSDLSALAANAGTGLWAITGVGTGSVRTLTAPAAGITVSNGGGVAGNPTLVLADDLGALEALATTGIARRTGTSTWSAGTAVALSEMATQAAFTFVGNNTSGSAAPTAVDIHALTLKASPAATDEVIISDQAASGAWKRVAVSSLASAGSVSSIAGNTGAFTLANGIGNTVNQIELTAARRTLPTTQSLTSGSSATYTTPANVLWIEVFMVGGGGGGGGVTNGTPGAVVAGSTGGTSTFNSVNAIGGGGSPATSASPNTALGGGVGGTGGTGTATRRAQGGPGGAGGTYTAALSPSFGGSSYFSGGTVQPASGAALGISAANNSGAGASGAAGGSTNFNVGSGGGGGELVYLIINSPSATYTYTIGAGGAGGTGGTSNGGTGGTGFIFVIEHYGS